MDTLLLPPPVTGVVAALTLAWCAVMVADARRAVRAGRRAARAGDPPLAESIVRTAQARYRRLWSPVLLLLAMILVIQVVASMVTLAG